MNFYQASLMSSKHLTVALSSADLQMTLTYQPYSASTDKKHNPPAATTHALSNLKPGFPPLPAPAMQNAALLLKGFIIVVIGGKIV